MMGMARIFLMPPRPQLGAHFAAFLHEMFPGLDWDEKSHLNLADGLASAAESRPDVFVVFRDDLPEGESTFRALIDACGAEEGDEIIEVRVGSRRGELLNQRWRLRLAA